MGYKTKEFLQKVDISEATLRRWLAESSRVPELKTAKKDWRGWRIWEEKHVEAVLAYKRSRMGE
jgi:adenine-specific DNA-methyltransferase